MAIHGQGHGAAVVVGAGGRCKNDEAQKKASVIFRAHVLRHVTQSVTSETPMTYAAICAVIKKIQKRVSSWLTTIQPQPRLLLDCQIHSTPTQFPNSVNQCRLR
jgi:hypothetical protein